VDWIKIFDSANDMQKRLANNRPQLLIVRGQRISLVKRENQLFAVQDACTHNGESLSKGSVNYLGEIVCPWHGYVFDLKTGRECAMRSADLTIYPIKAKEDGVFIGL
jgi:nitrite reductase/ring-hydroxylating ferredoxin subunit